MLRSGIGLKWPAADATAADGNLLSELYENLDLQTDSKSTAVLEMIWHQWQDRGDTDAAIGIAKEILERDPLHVGARDFIRKWLESSPVTARSASPPDSSSASASSSKATTTASSPPTSRPLSTCPLPYNVAAEGEAAAVDVGSIPTRRRPRLQPAGSISAQKTRALAYRATMAPILLDQPPQTEDEILAIENKITSLFAEVQERAAKLERDMFLLPHVGVVDNQALTQDLACLKEGIVSAVVMPPPQARSVQKLVSELNGSNWQQSLQAVVDDFLQVAQWALDDAEIEAQIKSSQAQVPSSSSSSSLPSAAPDTPSRLDIVRERLRQRQAVLDALLPESLEGLGRTAVLHVEHELVLLGDKTYANSETMLGDNVVDIPPENLLVTADNYAWDMSELADALAANSAVMRNPLTRDMFDDEDVRRILAHPLGQRLKPMTLSQSQLKKGVRPDTIRRLADLSKVMLEDQSAHATPTLEALDVFLAYFQTLPAKEKATLKQLSIPARDSHTGLAYDSSILEAVQDAKANRVCFHKAGDFLKQAAEYLKKL